MTEQRESNCDVRLGLLVNELFTLANGMADSVRDAVKEYHRVKTQMATVKMQQKRIERMLRTEVQGRNQQERDDYLDNLLESDPGYCVESARMLALDEQLGEVEATLECSKLKAKAAIAALGAING